MAFLGLDWGRKFVGYATADEEGMVITPRSYFERKVSQAKTWVLVENDISLLKKILVDWEVTHIVLGLPLNADGTESEASVSAQKLAQDLSKNLGCEVTLTDERLSSWEAKSSSKESHPRAAAVILKNYFEDRKIKK